MSSNMLAGERRWGTARKGGMTVLGKVAVPKPLNLPSQRLENHGMDPNVAIVPKGTLSWGSRGSSSGSDARNSSSLSSNADGGMASPSHRPSSGGSGTRPSTAGSDRTNEPLSSAWASNSRPSSAAGILPSNQAPLSSRPRSAETRPNSSQLSRFAEPAVKNSVPWGPSIPSERLGVKQDGFSLNSGDFPTLGSDREDSVKNVQYEDHSRPNSASGTSVRLEKDTTSYSDVQGRSFGTWRMEDSQGAEEAIHPSVGKWPGEPQHYIHANVPPQHFDPWCGPPVNPPDGHWDRGHPRGPQFRPPVGPNGFPMEPFPYYPPQLPPPHLAGPHPTGAAPRGHHPKNGDLYRPHIHDIHARPGMAFRPGFYPGPRGPMPFEGYYGPPRAYRNNEQDFPFMGMGPGRPVYDGYPGPAGPNLGNSHGRAAGYSPSGKTVPEKVDADHPEDSHRGKRVLLNHEHWDQKMAGENWEDKSEPGMLHPRKDYLPTMTSLRNEMGMSEHAKDGVFANRIAPSENLGASSEHRGHFVENTKEKSFKVLGKVKAVNDSWSNKSEEVASPTDTSQVPLASVTDSSVPAGPKDSALMQKIEGLNAKIRVSEEQRSGSQVEDLKLGVYTGEVSSNASFKKAPMSGDVPAHESVQPMGAVPRRSYHDGHGRDNYQGKGKFNGQDTDGWRRKAPPTGYYGAVITSNTESVTANNPQGYNVVAEAFENSQINPSGKNEGDIVGSLDDSTNEQRAKMRELARQRALQRQKEEEERAREQKAKALAKLEELNRRSLAGESGNAKSENTVVLIQNQGEQAGLFTSRHSETTRHNIAESIPKVASHSDVNTDQPVEHSSEMQQTHPPGTEELLLPACEESLDAGTKKVVLQSDDRGISTFKSTRPEQNQKVSVGKSSSDKSVPCVASEAPKDLIRIGTIDITLSEVPRGETREKESNAPSVSNAVAQPAEQQKRKSNHGKNKNELDVTPSQPMSPVKNEKESNDNIETRSSSPNFDSSVPTDVSAQEVSSLPSKESLSRVPNQRRTQPSRRMPRGQQANRLTDKLHGNDNVMWAPVRPHDRKAADLVESYKVSTEESANQTNVDGKSQNNSKGKRADMERYDTKAVVKELAQQGATPPSSKSDEVSVKEQSLSVKSENPQSAAGSVTENQEVDGRNSKRKKEHEVRRQWIATDTSHTEGGRLKPGPAEYVEQSKEQNEATRGENLSDNVKSSDVSHTSYGKYPPGKDQGMGRGKRHIPRGSRTIGNNHNPENIYSGDIEEGGSHSDSLQVHQTDKTIASKEIQNSTDCSHPHWKPKSSFKPASKFSGSESAAIEVNQPEKDHVEEGEAKASKHHKEIDKASDTQQVETVQHKAPAGPGGDTEDQLEHNRSSGFMKNRSQNNRPFRGHVPRRDWSSSHDFRAPHNAPHVFRERQRQNTHYEYQPVDPSKSNNKFEKAEDAPPERVENFNRRYQDSGPSHSKHGGGNFYKHQRGSTRVDSSHE